ncbi:MAG: DUF4340 domain-containing protein [Acidobacteria bacterium]|nr:DUF4340 domain-containing protein [Acidobacteriota bacterium]
MRGLRSLGGLLVVLIALGAYLYFVESKRTPGDDTPKKDKVFAVASDAIDEISIKAESGESTTLKKTGTEWQIVGPAAAPVDAAEVSGITTNLSTLEQQRVIDDNPSDLKEFGLAQPRIEIRFKTGAQEHTLLVGSKTPTGADLYAKTAAQSKVFLIASFLDSTFNRTSFDLRDKTALKFEQDATDSVEIATPARTIRFSKTNGQWQIAQPAAGRSDADAIAGLLARLNGLQMKTLAAAEATDLTQYGLDTPSASVQLGAGSSVARLLVGSAASEGNVYARDASRPAIFTIEASLLDELKKDAGEYRQKDLFDARAFNTTRLEVARAGQTTVFEKTTGKDKDGKDEEKWRQTAPSAKDVNRVTLDALLSALTSARATSFVDKPAAAAKSEATFSLGFDERKSERVSFLRAGSDAFAVREGSTGAARIETSVLDVILKALDEIK